LADKDFKVKNKLFVNGLSNASGVILATNNNLDSSTTLPTQYGGTGTTTSPNAGQIPYSSSGTNYAPTDLSSLTISSSGGSTITAASASTKGLTIQGAASQTANLTEWQNSSGTVISKIRSDGQFYAYGSQYGGSQYGSIGALGLAVGGQSGETSIHYAGGSLTVRSSTTGESSSGSAWTNNTSALIGTGYAGGIGLIIKSVASQTADLQQWQNNAGTVNARIDAYGTFQNGTASGYGAWINVQPALASDKGIIIRGAASQTADLQQWQNSSGTILASVSSIGTIRSNIFANTTGGLTYIATNFDTSGIGIVTSSAAQKGLIVRGSASQTANLQEWQNSSGTALSYITKDGTLDLRNTSATAFAFSNSGTVGPKIDLWGGQYGIGIVAGRMSFFTPASGGIALKQDSYSGTSVFDVAYNGAASIFLQSASAVGLIVKGAASQTANLQEWQNSSGTVLASVDSYGNMVSQALSTGITRVSFAGSYGASLNVIPYGTAQQGIIVRAVASQTANLQEWQNSSGTVLASISAAGNLTVQDLTVNGTTTTINSTTLTVDDKNIELASVASPTDTTADGAGITIKGATDKTFNWVQSTGAFTSSEPISTPALSVSGNSVSSNITLAAGKRYFVDTTSARTLTLPASPSLGDEIKIFDASGTAATNNITIARNGNKINGITDDAIIDVNQASSAFVYTGATVGWRFE
jgi:hypothetical protein